MTIRGLIRLAAAQARAAERQAARETRSAARYEAWRSKQQRLAQAEAVVDEFNAHMQRLATLHADCGESLDWEALATLVDPAKPEREWRYTTIARRQSDSYKPSLWDTITFQTKRRRSDLAQGMLIAEKRDDEAHRKAIQAWEQTCGANKAQRELANGVLRQDEDAWKEALQTLCPLDTLSSVAKTCRMRWDGSRVLQATLEIADDEVIPDTVLTFTKTGKLSEKAMGQKRRWEMYEDLVCAAAIRTAREVFAVLPFQSVAVHCSAEAPNRETGAIEQQVVLSVHYPRVEFQALRFDGIDPSDSMRRFVHNKDFKRGEGFRPVQQLAI